MKKASLITLIAATTFASTTVHADSITSRDVESLSTQDFFSIYLNSTDLGNGLEASGFGVRMGLNVDGNWGVVASAGVLGDIGSVNYQGENVDTDITGWELSIGPSYYVNDWLSVFATAGVGNVGHFHDVFGYVPGAGAFADSGFQGFDQVVGDGLAVGRDYEQDHFHVAVDLAADHEAVVHLADGFHLAVDFGGADAHAAGVEHGVGAAVDHHATLGRPRGVVAVSPDTGEAFEVRGAITTAVGVIPEADRHRRKRVLANQLSTLIDETVTAIVKHIDIHTKREALQLAASYGQHRIAAGKATENIGTTGNRRELYVGFHMLVDVVEALGRERRAGGGAPQYDIGKIEMLQHLF